MRMEGKGMRRELFAAWMLFAVLAVPAAVRADDMSPAPAVDAHGKPTTATDDAGNTVWYRYDANGTLLEERYSDGRVVRHEPSTNAPSNTGLTVQSQQPQPAAR